MRTERILTEHRRFLATLDHPEQTQQTVLAELLAANGATSYLREHGLNEHSGAEEFRKALPIRTQNAFGPWIERAMAGEDGVLTAERPVAYFSSSGSTGQEKRIPVTPTYMKRCFLPFYHASFAVLLGAFPDLAADPGGVLNLWRDPTSPHARTADGRPHLGLSQIDYRLFGEAGGPGPDGAAWATIPEQLSDADPWERAYLQLRLAAEQDIKVLIGVNPALIAGLPYQLAAQWPRIVEEIARGTVGGVPHTTPDPRRAEQIERRADEYGVLHPYHLWPNLRAAVAWNSALASLYLPRVRERYGPGVRLFAAPIGSSEGPVAVPVDDHPNAAPLYLPGCYFEFADAAEPIREDSPTVTAAELEPGRDYHLVLSHIGGLYRCAVNDVVHVVDHVGRTPRIAYTGRDVLRTVGGVDLTERAVVRALAGALADTGAELRNATVETGTDRFHAAIASALPGPLPAGFATALDKRLGETAGGYRAARDAGALAPVEVLQVHQDAFQREWEHAIRAGRRRTRVKDRIFQPAPDSWARITADERTTADERAHA
ncbi:GH3 auxin-responsive promoter family protein [Streptomyces shenzhenensis]|uniref:GH3 family domain-containing protein n=1 Tax=Streptomyces shenzhenensis TaxID=943815 RepID=UPI003820C121